MSPVARVALAAFTGVAVLGGLVWLGRIARQDLDRRGHYTLVVDQLDVPAPPGMTRLDFLAEVCYQSGLPAKLDRADATSMDRLKGAFASHPWVETAELDDSSPQQPLKLTFRTPTLKAGALVLDRFGYLLPRRTSGSGLPEFRGQAQAHFVTSGQPVGDQTLATVAKTIGWLREQLPDTKWRFADLTDDGLILVRADGGRAIWGLATDAEPAAEEKLARLKTWKGEHIDLRNK